MACINVKATIEQILDTLRGVWRFRWRALAVAWTLCLAGWLTIICLPDRYEAAARVFVDTRTTLSRATEGLTMATDIDSQIERVREALLGGPELEEVARKEGLQLDGTSPGQRQNVITDLREHIQITPRGGGLYVISYTDRNRQRALGVVSRLLNNFVADTLGGKRAGSEQAQRFLVQQIREDEARLAAAEDRLAAFKKKNVGLLPGSQSDYFSRLQEEMETLSKTKSELAIAQSRRDQLLRQARGEPVIGSEAPAPTARGGAAVDDNTLAARIRGTQARLDELLLKFTDKHPDVIALRATIDELKERQQAEIDAIKHGDTGAASRMGLGSNPVFQEIQVQLNQAEVEIAGLRGKVANSQQKIADLKLLVDTAPEVEAEFARLNRDYDVTRTRYQALVQRLEQSRLSQQAEETGVVRFEVIDPPSSPFKPVSPKRAALILAVLLMSIAAGGGVAFVFHEINPVFSSARQLNDITGLPVLGVVSMTWLERHRTRERVGAIAYLAAASLLIVATGAVFLAQSHATRILQGWMGQS